VEIPSTTHTLFTSKQQNHLSDQTSIMASYLITGAARGIGFALVKTLASMPKSDVATIFATSRSQSATLKELAGNNPDRVVFVELEVTNEASIQNAVKLVGEKLNGKGLDVLINNAGIMGTAPGGAPAM
jgi:NAD(P)-dependent dehydrogenase (short-subunit alcohol dehydrogenase family)